MKMALAILSSTILFYTHAVIGQTITVLPTNVSCNGVCNGTATVSVSGSVPPYIYYWSNGQSGPMFKTMNNLCPGTYTVTVQDNNFNPVGTESVTITEPPQITFTTSTTNATTGQNNGSAKIVSAGGGTGMILFTWSNSVQGQTITGLSCGTYSVTATDNNGCTATDTAVVACVTGINELNDENGFDIYPNPSNGNFTFKSKTEVKKCVVMDVPGNIVYSAESIQSASFDISLSQLSNGIYFLKVADVHDKEQVRKVIIEH